MSKDEIISEYKRVREILNASPSANQFYIHSRVSKRMMEKTFGRNSFSSLVIACGDIPKGFLHKKSDLNDILIQYGNLVRVLRKLPIIAEWENAKLKPTVGGIEQSHKIKWSQLPEKFREFGKSKKEWQDVIELMPDLNEIAPPELKNEECYVYIMFNLKTLLYKIGISKIAEYREKTLQSQEPSIKLIASKKYINRRIAEAFEKALHETYSHKWKRGEWFSLNGDEVSEIMSALK